MELGISSMHPYLNAANNSEIKQSYQSQPNIFRRAWKNDYARAGLTIAGLTGTALLIINVAALFYHP